MWLSPPGFFPRPLLPHSSCGPPAFPRGATARCLGSRVLSYVDPAHAALGSRVPMYVDPAHAAMKASA